MQWSVQVSEREGRRADSQTVFQTRKFRNTMQECHPLDRDVRCVHVWNRILAFFDVTGSPGVYEVAVILLLYLVRSALGLLTFMLTTGKGLLQIFKRPTV